MVTTVSRIRHLTGFSKMEADFVRDIEHATKIERRYISPLPTGFLQIALLSFATGGYKYANYNSAYYSCLWGSSVMTAKSPT